MQPIRNRRPGLTGGTNSASRGHVPRGRASAARRAGFALPELGALLALGIVIVCLLAIVASDARRQAGLHHSLSNLRQIGALTGQYVNDNDNLMWGFSWKAGESPSEFPDLRFASTDAQAGANQAVDIMRRRADYMQVNPILGWIPHLMYSHLPLYDYMDGSAPDRLFLSPGDRVRQKWADLGFPDWASSDVPKPQNYESLVASRWVVSSSYEVGTAFCSSPDAGMDAMRLSTSWSITTSPHTDLGHRSLDEVAYPQDKAMAFPRHDWFFGDVPLYSANADARTPVLAVDGAARVRKTGDMNQGFHPALPTSPEPMSYSHRPQDWEPPLRDGTWGTETVIGHHRLTRSGLRGRDFNGTEIPWED